MENWGTPEEEVQEEEAAVVLDERESSDEDEDMDFSKRLKLPIEERRKFWLLKKKSKDEQDHKKKVKIQRSTKVQRNEDASKNIKDEVANKNIFDEYKARISLERNGLIRLFKEIQLGIQVFDDERLSKLLQELQWIASQPKVDQDLKNICLIIYCELILEDGLRNGMCSIESLTSFLNNFD